MNEENQERENLLDLVVPNQEEDTSENENSDTQKHMGGRPLLFKTVDEFNAKCEEYFQSCWTQKINMYGDPVYLKDESGKKDLDQKVMVQTKPYTITGLAVFLDTSRETLMNYKKRDEFFDSIKRVREMCHAYAEESLFTAKNATGAIFNLKNNYGWKDEQKVDHTSGGKIIRPVVVAEIKPHDTTQTETTTSN